MDRASDQCGEGVQAGRLGRVGKTKQVSCASAIGGAKTCDDNAGSGQLPRSTCPIAFAADCVFHHPHLRNACPRCVEQIVHVPMKTFLSAEVALQSSAESTGAERAADIEIETGGEGQSSSPANADVARAVKRDQERIGSRNRPQGAVPQCVYRHCQTRSMSQVNALPVASSADPITSAWRKPWLALNVHTTGPDTESGNATANNPRSSNNNPASAIQNTSRRSGIGG